MRNFCNSKKRWTFAASSSTTLPPKRRRSQSLASSIPGSSASRFPEKSKEKEPEERYGVGSHAMTGIYVWLDHYQQYCQTMTPDPLAYAQCQSSGEAQVA